MKYDAQRYLFVVARLAKYGCYLLPCFDRYRLKSHISSRPRDHQDDTLKVIEAPDQR